MNNAEKFQETFGIYATEMWAMPESDFLNWLNSLHDAKASNTTDLISRQDAINALVDMHCKSDEDGYVWIIRSDAWASIDALPSTELKKEYTKADYIMALHKEYGCTLERAREAHNKALEYLRNTSMLKG